MDINVIRLRCSSQQTSVELGNRSDSVSEPSLSTLESSDTPSEVKPLEVLRFSLTVPLEVLSSFSKLL